APAKRETVDGCDHGLAEILNQVENSLPEGAGFFCFDSGDPRQFTDVGAGNERFIACSGENDAANCRVLSRIFKSGLQIFPRSSIQCVEDLRTIKRYVGDWPFLLIQNVLKGCFCSW